MASPLREVRTSELALVAGAKVLDGLHQDGTWITAEGTDCSHTSVPPVENTIVTYVNLQSLGVERSEMVVLSDNY